MPTPTRTATVHALRTILDRSPFVPILLHRTRRFGIGLDDGGLVVDVDWDAGQVEVTHVDDVAAAHAPLWIATTDRELEDLAIGEPAQPRLLIRSERTQPTAAERLLLKVFSPAGAPMATGERESTIYPALFGDAAPTRLWRCDDDALPVEALRFTYAVDGLHALVTSGLSNPELGPAAFAYAGQRLSGFGYELVMLTDELDGEHHRQFLTWVGHVCATGRHLVRGHWVEFDDGVPPGTSLGGHLLVPPSRFPGEFPMGDGTTAWLNLMMPATPAEIEAVKQTSVPSVADRIFEAGHEDFSPLTRASTV